MVAGVHPGGDAHGRAAVQWCQRAGPDEQDRGGARHAAGQAARSGGLRGPPMSLVTSLSHLDNSARLL